MQKFLAKGSKGLVPAGVFDASFGSKRPATQFTDLILVRGNLIAILDVMPGASGTLKLPSDICKRPSEFPL